MGCVVRRLCLQVVFHVDCFAQFGVELELDGIEHGGRIEHTANRGLEARPYFFAVAADAFWVARDAFLFGTCKEVLQHGIAYGVLVYETLVGGVAFFDALPVGGDDIECKVADDASVYQFVVVDDVAVGLVADDVG